MHFYEGYHFWGMHLFWWFIWVVLLIWIFATPYSIPGERKIKDTPIDILKRSFAMGEITEEEYEQRKLVLEED